MVQTEPKVVVDDLTPGELANLVDSDTHFSSFKLAESAASSFGGVY